VRDRTRRLACFLFSVPLCLGGSASLAAQAGRVKESERLAAAALARAAGEPDAALAEARRALALTEEFDPTEFVAAGRRGEVVEDAFQAARDAYRRHRARAYEAVGAALAARREVAPARRYLSRAVLLEPLPARVHRLAAVLIADGQPRAALDLLHRHLAGPGYGADGVVLVEKAVDAAGLPSAQAEMDGARLRALAGAAGEPRLGAPRLPAQARLSTGGRLRLEEALTVFYVAAQGCRTCSADMEALRKAVAPPARVVLVPENPNEDQSLRQVASLYRVDWPLLLGAGVAQALDVTPGSALVTARGGFVSAAVSPPFGVKLPPVLAVFARSDVQETLPRAGFKPARPEPTPSPPARPALPDHLAYGEDDPPPAPFVAALDAYRAGRPLEALRFFDALAGKQDGWLLPPEARLNRAVCLGALGRTGEARRLLLRIGDARAQEGVDRALESLSPGRGARP
jgi:hypothetical protein